MFLRSFVRILGIYLFFFSTFLHAGDGFTFLAGKIKWSCM